MSGFLISLLAVTLVLPAAAQVFTVQPEGVAAKYLQFKQTDVKLSPLPITQHDRQELLRYLQAEQGFSMRPLPVATLKLRANGKLDPMGEDYVNLVQKKGIAVEAGKRVMVTDVKVDKDKIVLEFNGGPDHKHKWLRHISFGVGGYETTPLMLQDPKAPTGTRIELKFPHGVPDLTGPQVEALIKPLVDFSLKTPLEAFADTLPSFLKKAVLAHHVLVGMDHRMVLSAMGQPRTKMHDMENGKALDIWIYGEPPDPTQFVHFDGDRVVKLEIGRVGKPLEVHATDQMRGYWSTHGTENARVIHLGDTNQTDVANQSAPAAVPTLRNPGETLPADTNPNTPQMGPVEFPPGMGGAGPGGQPATTQQGPSSQPAGQPAPTPAGQDAPK